MPRNATAFLCCRTRARARAQTRPPRFFPAICGHNPDIPVGSEISWESFRHGAHRARTRVFIGARVRATT